MSKLWNAIYRGFRYQVRAGAPLLEEENDAHKSVTTFRRTVPTALINCQEQFQSSNHEKQYNFNRFHKQNEPYLFLEICGISSAFSLGWQYFHPDQHKKDQPPSERSNLVKVLANVALAQPGVTQSKTRLSILPEKTKLSLPGKEAVPNKSEQETSSTKEQIPEAATNAELEKIMASMARTLKKADEMLVAEWQNDAGVQLMTAARNGECCPQYDKLIKCKGDRKVRYFEEALNCFNESRKLGSAKGAFNLGLCYEQGLGTVVDLEEAAQCYAEAAAQGHAKAQYNLSLLHYQQKLQSSDRLMSFKLMSSAANQGLQQAQSALQVMTFDSDAASMTNRNYSGNSLIRNEDRSSSFRKIRSEPHCMNLEEVEEIEHCQFNPPIALYVDGY